jgi:hypothetical protein
VQICRERNNVRAYPVSADGARQSLQSTHVVASQGCGSLDFIMVDYLHMFHRNMTSPLLEALADTPAVLIN